MGRKNLELGSFPTTHFVCCPEKTWELLHIEVSDIPGAGLSAAPVADVAHYCLVQMYYCSWAMREGWLIDPGTNWVWRFHRDDKAWVRDPKVFMDRGMAMPDGEPPPLLKDADTSRRRTRKPSGAT